MADKPRNIRDAIKSLVPNWLADRVSLRAGFSVLYTIALIADAFVEQMYEGVLAPFPRLGTNTALPLIGRSRGILQGLIESDDAYAARLRAWLDTWENAGSAEILLGQIQAFLGSNYVCRLVDRSGNFVTIAADGSTSVDSDPSWDWDGAATPSRATHWSDIWIVVYVNDGRFPIYTSFSDSAWLAAWGTSQGFGVGHQVTRAAVDGVRSIVAAFKGAHTYLQAVIFTNDTTKFIPGSLGGTPDGNYANWSKADGSNHQVPARAYDLGSGKYVRYWIPATGG